MEIEVILGFSAVMLMFLLLHIRLTLISKLVEIQLEMAKSHSEQFQGLCRELAELTRILEKEVGEDDVPF